MLKFPYKTHPRFPKKFLFPLIEIEIYSTLDQSWEKVRNLLVDTGASISLLPLSIGMTLLPKIKTSREISLGGIVPGKQLKAWVHSFRMRINGIMLKVPVAIAEKEIIPILGRQGVLDRMVATFSKGKVLILKR